jgi:ADP-heptose:LPS heptosyltransferase
MKPMTRTLIVYLHGIGDNLMFTGVLKEYHRRYPRERIDLLVLNAGCAAIWKGNPHVEQVSIYPGTQPYFWNPVKFYLLHQWRVRRYIRAKYPRGCYQRVFFPTLQTLPEIIYHVTGTYGRHKLDRMCAALGVARELYAYDMHPTALEAAEADARVGRFAGQPLAVLHPFSGHALKRISPAGFGQILQELQGRGFATLVVGATQEQAKFCPGWNTESAFGLSLGTLIEVLRRAQVFAGTDSAVAHLAAAANTSRIIVFSPKLEPRRYLPISEQGRISLIRIGRDREQDSLEEFRRVLG